MKKTNFINRQKSEHNESGFTIVELMIALSVLSVILLVSTVVLISIGALYSKGVNMANLQNSNRNIVNDVASELQFSGRNFVTGSTVTQGTAQVRSYCIGATRYSYVLGNVTGIAHTVWRDTMDSTVPCVPVSTLNNPSTDPRTVPGTGVELASDNMHIGNFSIVSTTIPGSTTPVIRVNVAMGYGDSDLLDLTTNPAKPTCKGGAGTQYCAVSSITTNVTPRL